LQTANVVDSAEQKWRGQGFGSLPSAAKHRGMVIHRQDSFTDNLRSVTNTPCRGDLPGSSTG